MKKYFFVFSVLCLSRWALAQYDRPQFPCDSLSGKSYAFLYDAASSIMEAQIIDVANTGYSARYTLKSHQNYKGGLWGESFIQNEHPQWYTFEEGQTFVFLIFKDFVDPAFSPCILFGHKAKMGGLIAHAQTRCEETYTPHHNAPCYRIYSPVCGCNGITYGNACEAEVRGITTYDEGPCEDRR